MASPLSSSYPVHPSAASTLSKPKPSELSLTFAFFILHISFICSFTQMFVEHFLCQALCQSLNIQMCSLLS